jgi:DNA primase
MGVPWWVEQKGTRRSVRRRKSVTEIRRAVPIGKLLEHYGGSLEGARPLSHADWAAIRCPFHRDQRPSASVNHKLGRFRCHGSCDFGGDIIDIVMWREGLTVGGAIDWLTERFL